MIIDVLVYTADGTQKIVQREVPDDYFDSTETEAEPSQLDRVEAQATYTAMMTDTLLEV